MGIKGLLPFLKDQQRIVHLKEFSGCTAAIDVYCWLHKAVYGCVDQIMMGNDQGQYIRYCERNWNALLSAGIKPILVFDGQNLPAKAKTEKGRREKRAANRERGNSLLAEGRRAEARVYFERCIDITPHMAHKVIIAAVKQGIDCIVAPYEADAQLAYFSLNGIAQLIISEDSDLLTFGCLRVLFKFDGNAGTGVLIERAAVLQHKNFNKRVTFEHFVHMCLISGCDYIDSLPGIGLGKSSKYISQCRDMSNIEHLLRRLPLSLKMSRGIVTDEYISAYKKAYVTFKHQVVFNPVKRKREHLRSYKDPETSKHLSCCGIGEDHPDDMSFCGRFFPETQSLQMALGNINLNNMETLLPEIDPELLLHRPNGKLSIWHPSYKPLGPDMPQSKTTTQQDQPPKSALIITPVTKRTVGNNVPLITVPQASAIAFDLVCSPTSPISASSQLVTRQTDNNYPINEVENSSSIQIMSDKEDVISGLNDEGYGTITAPLIDSGVVASQEAISAPFTNELSVDIFDQVEEPNIAQLSPILSEKLDKETRLAEPISQNITPNYVNSKQGAEVRSRFFSNNEDRDVDQPKARKRLAPWVEEVPVDGPVKLRPLVEAIDMASHITDEILDSSKESEPPRKKTSMPLLNSPKAFNPFRKTTAAVKQETPQPTFLPPIRKNTPRKPEKIADPFNVREIKLVGSPSDAPVLPPRTSTSSRMSLHDTFESTTLNSAPTSPRPEESISGFNLKKLLRFSRTVQPKDESGKNHETSNLNRSMEDKEISFISLMKTMKNQSTSSEIEEAPPQPVVAERKWTSNFKRKFKIKAETSFSESLKLTAIKDCKPAGRPVSPYLNENPVYEEEAFSSIEVKPKIFPLKTIPSPPNSVAPNPVRIRLTPKVGLSRRRPNENSNSPIVGLLSKFKRQLPEKLKNGDVVDLT